MPVIDQLSEEYEGEVQFISVAWKGSLEATADRAGELLTSGNVTWGLDDSGEFFSTWGIGGQPWTVLITGDDIEYQRWPGVLGEDELRSRIDSLVEASAGV